MGAGKEVPPPKAEPLRITAANGGTTGGQSHMKHTKRFTALVLALVMVFSLTTGASAAAAENVKVQLSPNIITYNGEAQTMADVNGNPVYPILNGGTTYLPIRAVGNMLGLDVDWDGATQTVLLNKSADGKTPAKSGNATASDSAPTEITAQINPGITVKYNGKAQNMADVNGNPVYPMLYGGTTYLPVRAVSNMLGIDVDWDGATQTVILGAAHTDNDGITEVTIDNATPDKVREALKATGANESEIEYIIMMLDPGTLDGTGSITLQTGSSSAINKKTAEEFIASFKTSQDAAILGENHLAYDYAEIDWSTADEGFIRVKLNKQMTKVSRCEVRWYGENYNYQSNSFVLPLDKWVNIPLFGGSNEYFVSVAPICSEDDLNENKSDEELDAIWRDQLQVRFTAKIPNPDVVWLLSTIDIDFENAPLTCAKALEITKDCKTDAEKITAVFNWVASNIKYDYKLYDEIIAWGIKRHAKDSEINPMIDLFQDGAREHLALDDILTTKSGVCEDKATLMVGMLRSLGIPCKYVSGNVYSGKIIKGYNDNNPGWMGHAWVAISPDVEGLNLSALGAGHETDGWIRLDPTNAHNKTLTANDKNYTADSAY